MQIINTYITLFTMVIFAANISAFSDDQQSYCFSIDPKLGDSAYWASAGINFYNSGQLKKAISVVDNCFEYYAEDALYQQNQLKKAKTPPPPIGRVDFREKEKIFANYAVNDVSMALWTKAVSAEKLGEIDIAMDAYAKCIYLDYGRAWDPNGWFWNPSEDCAKRGKRLIK
jgi:tetratricopeptide (TPR) repeat protein